MNEEDKSEVHKIPEEKKIDAFFEKQNSKKIGLAFFNKKDLIVLGIFAVAIMFFFGIMMPFIWIIFKLQPNSFVYVTIILLTILAIFILAIVKSLGWFSIGIKLWLDKKANPMIFVSKANRIFIEAGIIKDEIEWDKKQPEKKMHYSYKNIHIDTHTNRPLPVFVEEVRENVNLLQEYKPDEANKNINSALQQEFMAGYNMGKRENQFDKRIFIIILALCALAFIAAAISAFNGMEMKKTVDLTQAGFESLSNRFTTIEKIFDSNNFKRGNFIPSGTQVVS